MDPTPVARRLKAITVVANDVGGVGGMQRQLGELVTGLLEGGVEVTVVTRTCRVKRRSGLT